MLFHTQIYNTINNPLTVKHWINDDDDDDDFTIGKNFTVIFKFNCCSIGMMMTMMIIIITIDKNFFYDSYLHVY